MSVLQTGDIFCGALMVCHAEAVPKHLRSLIQIGSKIGAEVLHFVQDDKILILCGLSFLNCTTTLSLRGAERRGNLRRWFCCAVNYHAGDSHAALGMTYVWDFAFFVSAGVDCGGMRASRPTMLIWVRYGERRAGACPCRVQQAVS